MISAIVAALVGLAVGAFVAFVGMRGARIDPGELSRPKPLAEDPLRPRSRAELDALVAQQSEPLWPEAAELDGPEPDKPEAPVLTRAQALELARRMNLPDPRPRKKAWQIPTVTRIPRWAARALIFSRRIPD